MAHALRPLLAPRSVAVIGASNDPRKRGHQAVAALLDGGYRGRIVPINPRGGEILGLPVARRIEAVADPPELAFVATRAASVPDMVAACARRGVRAAVVVAGGFREAGDQGEALERALVAICRRTGIRVLGPNTSGLLNARLGLNLVGVEGVRAGSLAVLSQSGNVGLDLMLRASEHGPGISIYAGIGNEADVGAHEILTYLAKHRETAAILLYVEGLREGWRFLEAARRAARCKPVVLLKGGRTEAGTAAARTHTGAIVGSPVVLTALLRQHGVVEVARSDELFAVGATLAQQPAATPGGGIAILADGGGHATLAADALAELEVPLARLGAATRRRLRRALGHAATTDNPVDLAGAADHDPEAFVRASRALAADPAVGAVLMTGLFGGYAIRFDAGLASAEARVAPAIARTMAVRGKPLVVHTLYARARNEALEQLAAAHVPVVDSIEVAARCARALFLRGLALANEPLPPVSRARTSRVSRRIIAAALAEGRDALTEDEARRLVAVYGVPTVAARLCRSEEEVAGAAREIAGALALKAVSPLVLHKTDAGALALDVVGPSQAAAAFHEVVRAVAHDAEQRGLVPDVRGVLVAEMLAPPIAELLIGARRDAQYGAILAVASGGTLAELARDVAVRALPIARADALAMLDEIRMAPVLHGYRGRPRADRDALADIALALGACLLSNPELEAVELNPVFAYAERAVAVDVRATLHDTGLRRAARTSKR